MKTAKKVLWGAFVVLTLILAVALGYRLVMMLAFPERLPSAFGYSSSLVASGSMEPTLSTGDMVICRAQESYALDDVIAYYDEEEEVFILHRIIGSGEDGWITQGDFNPVPDPLPVKKEQIQGKVVYTLPNMKSARDVMLGAMLALLIEHTLNALSALIQERRKKGGDEADETE